MLYQLSQSGTPKYHLYKLLAFMIISGTYMYLISFNLYNDPAKAGDTSIPSSGELCGTAGI